MAHRDYEVHGRETEIWFYENRLEVSSPGELVPPVTVEALCAGRRTHAARNPMLVRVLADAEIMRDEGEGIARIFQEMTQNLLREPKIASAVDDEATRGIDELCRKGIAVRHDGIGAEASCFPSLRSLNLRAGFRKTGFRSSRSASARAVARERDPGLSSSGLERRATGAAPRFRLSGDDTLDLVQQRGTAGNRSPRCGQVYAPESSPGVPALGAGFIPRLQLRHRSVGYAAGGRKCPCARRSSYGHAGLLHRRLGRLMPDRASSTEESAGLG